LVKNDPWGVIFPKIGNSVDKPVKFPKIGNSVDKLVLEEFNFGGSFCYQNLVIWRAFFGASNWLQNLAILGVFFGFLAFPKFGNGLSVMRSTDSKRFISLLAVGNSFPFISRL